MSNSDARIFMDNDKVLLSRFSQAEILEQKDEIVIYILTELTGESLESLEESIEEIRAITGYELSIEAARIIRRLAMQFKMTKEERNILCKK